MSAYIVLTFVHVLLFAYWLGADWGVYVTARYIADPELSLPERGRFLRAAFQIDFMPRLAFTLLLPVGLQLAAFHGAWPPTGPFMSSVWAAALAWCAITMLGSMKPGTSVGDVSRYLDTGIRACLAPTLIVAGASSLSLARPALPTFIAVKLVVFGLMIVVGLILRAIMRRWMIGFQRLAKEGRSRELDALFTESLAKARWIAYVMWTLSGTMALLGVARFA